MKKGGLLLLIIVALVAASIGAGGCTRPKPPVSPPPTTVKTPKAAVKVKATPTSGPQPTATSAPPTTPTPTTVPPGTPTSTPAPSEYIIHVVQPGENLFRIALRYGTNYWTLAALNNIANPHYICVGQELRIPKGEAPEPGARIHIVQRGENLFRIALRYGVTVEAIAKANNIINPDFIFAGQKLVIPPPSG